MWLKRGKEAEKVLGLQRHPCSHAHSEGLDCSRPQMKEKNKDQSVDYHLRLDALTVELTLT